MTEAMEEGERTFGVGLMRLVAVTMELGCIETAAAAAAETAEAKLPATSVGEESLETAGSMI